MHTTQEIIHEAASLPVEERAIIVDTLLRTLNTPDPGFDQEWFTVARRRLDELNTGKVNGIPGTEVMAKLHERFSR